MILIEELIAKLEVGQGPDRELDCMVEAFEEKVTGPVRIVRHREDGPVAYWKAVRSDPSHPVPEHEVLRMGKLYTSSLDEAVAFAVRTSQQDWSYAVSEAVRGLARRHDWHICLKRPGQEDELPREIVLQSLRRKAGLSID